MQECVRGNARVIVSGDRVSIDCADGYLSLPVELLIVQILIPELFLKGLMRKMQAALEETTSVLCGRPIDRGASATSA
jgi:hypothetical protein